MMLSASDQYKIRQKSTWDDPTKTWTIPHFITVDKKSDIAFPTINAKQRVDQSKEDKEISFESDDN